MQAHLHSTAVFSHTYGTRMGRDLSQLKLALKAVYKPHVGFDSWLMPLSPPAGCVSELSIDELACQLALPIGMPGLHPV